MLSKAVYLDNNATTQIHPDLKNLIPTWIEAWGNPSSIHTHGREAKKWIREARQNFSKLIGANPLEIIFTSGGSEANNTVIKGVLASPLALQRQELITTAIEHPSVLRAMEFAESLGFKVHKVPVNRDGLFDFSFFESVLSEKTLLVSVMTANNETGVVLPIKDIVEKAKMLGALVHTDAVQTVGRIPFSVNELGVDFASFSGHKFYALKGSGVLYTRRGQGLENLIHGGGQERGRRAGTENTLAIASLGYMAQKISEEKQKTLEVQKLRDEFEVLVLKNIPQVKITAQKSLRLPNTSSLVIEGVNGESLLMSLDVKGFSVSTGAACSSGSPEPSHVLLALGLRAEEAQSSLRVSLGWMSTREDVLRFIDVLKLTVEHLRNLKNHRPTEALHV